MAVILSFPSGRRIRSRAGSRSMALHDVFAAGDELERNEQSSRRFALASALITSVVVVALQILTT